MEILEKTQIECLDMKTTIPNKNPDMTRLRENWI